MRKDDMNGHSTSPSSIVSGSVHNPADPGTPPNYQEFLDGKTHYAGMDGFKPVFMPEYLFPFQKDLLSWAIEKGRAAS